MFYQKTNTHSDLACKPLRQPKMNLAVFKRLFIKHTFFFIRLGTLKYLINSVEKEV